MLNIAEIEVLEQYLQDRGLVRAQDGHKIHYCKGGVSGTVAFVERRESPMIIKQALAQLKTKDVWLCNPNRMSTEYESNRIYHELAPEHTPQVYFYDKENYIYGREAIPDGCPMWKEQLLEGLLDFRVAEKSVETLVKVHNACSGRQDVKELFASREIFYGLRVSPYMEFTVEKYPELEEFAARVVKEVMETDITLVHGDYSPKNIMVIGREISVLDYEVAHYGHPAFDLAFFSNHFVLKAVKFREYGIAYLAMLRYMVQLYFAQMNYMDKAEFESCYVRTLALLMLARIDGKSPVEYLVGETVKQELVRSLTHRMVREHVETFEAVDRMLCQELNDSKRSKCTSGRKL